MHNRIRLITNSMTIPYKKWKNFNGCFENDTYPTELKNWHISQKEEAEAELKRFRCNYKVCYDNTIEAEEYALEYYTADEDGEFLEGSDYDTAETEYYIISNGCDFTHVSEKNFMELAKKLYRHLNLDEDSIVYDTSKGILTENFGSDGNYHLWYDDNEIYGAICTTTEKIIDTEEEIKKLFGATDSE